MVSLHATTTKTTKETEVEKFNTSGAGKKYMAGFKGTPGEVKAERTTELGADARIRMKGGMLLGFQAKDGLVSWNQKSGV